MYTKLRILVVDDEMIFSDDIREFLADKFSSIAMVDNCYHPVKALRLFKSEKYNLIVTDIRMPEMTGIEMVRQMKEIDPSIRVIYLTGYNDFEYCYQAVNQEIDYFVLKTEGDEILLDAVKNALDRINSDMRFQREYDRTERYLSFMAPIYRQQVLNEILSGGISTKEQLSTALVGIEDFDYGEENAKALMILGKPTLKMPYNVAEKLIVTISQMITKIFGTHLKGIETTFYNNTCVWLLEGERESIINVLFSSLGEIQTMISRDLNSNLSFIIGSHLITWTKWENTFNRLSKYIGQMMVDTSPIVLIEESITDGQIVFNGEPQNIENAFPLSSAKITMSMQYLESQNFKAYKNSVHKILSDFEDAPRHSFYALELFRSIEIQLIEFINKMNLRIKLASQFQLINLFEPGEFSTWHDERVYLEDLIDKISVCCHEQKLDSEYGMVQKIKSYVLNNVSGDLSLNKIGQCIGFNPSYVSRMFKQLEGVGIHEYIENIRMETAKHLIEGSEMKIYDIAEKCGYNNPAYFGKIFRLKYHVTPQECRNNKRD